MSTSQKEFYSITDVACIPAEEVEAEQLVKRIGYEEANSRLNNLFLSARNRMEELLDGCHPGFVPSGYTERNYLTKDECRQVHLLSLGLSICFDPRVEARNKVLDRVNERRRKSGKPLVK